MTGATKGRDGLRPKQENPKVLEKDYSLKTCLSKQWQELSNKWEDTEEDTHKETSEDKAKRENKVVDDEIVETQRVVVDKKGDFKQVPT